MAVSSVGSILENRERFAHLADDNRGEFSIDTFYQLLMAEMSNQDPLDPVSNTEFISQLASFTSLQVQQEALYFNNANYARSMVGKKVVVASNATIEGRLDVETGIVTSVHFAGGDFRVTVNGREFPLSSVMEVVDPNQGMPGSNAGAFATSLIGKYVTVQVLVNGQPIVESGIVQRIEIRDGVMSVIIDDVAYPLHSVAIINPPEVADGDDDGASAPGGIVVGGEDED